MLVNGVQSSEIPHVLDSLRKVRTAVKQQAFAALSAAVGRRRRTLQQTRGLIDAMKVPREFILFLSLKPPFLFMAVRCVRF